MSAASKTLAIAVKNRERYFQRVQQTYDLISKPASKKEFIQRCKLLDDTYQKFETVTEKILELNSQLSQGENPVETLQSSKSFEELFFQAKAHEAQIAQASSEAATANVPVGGLQPKLKLPTISVPVFSGDITEFPSWKSLYDELIHLSNLSDIQKFSYMKTYVKGPALSAIDTIAFTSANYPLAYKTLNDRYSKTRTLASHFMNKLLDFHPISKDTLGSLRSFLDHFHVVVESIKSLAINNLEEFMLLHLGLRVLDSKTTMEFENEQKDKNFPTFDDLVKFVTNKVNILDLNAESSHVTNEKKPSVHSKMLVTHVKTDRFTPDVYQSKSATFVPRSNPVNQQSRASPQCSLCHKGYHKIGFCPKFKSLDSHQRFDVIKNLQLCFNCFSSSHTSSQCTSSYSCRTCGSNAHHSFLHPSSSDTKPNYQYSNPNHNEPSHSKQDTPASNSEKQVSLQSQVSLKCNDSLNGNNVLLGTASIQVQDFMGNWFTVRCVIDPGSQISAMTEKLAQIIKLPRQPCGIEVSGIGSNNCVKSKGEIVCNILPHDQISKLSNCDPIQIKTIVLPRIASNLLSHVPSAVLQGFAHLQLADLTYYSNTNVSSSIDMLLGAEYYAQLIISAHPIIQGFPAAVASKLGWLLIGRVNETSESYNQEQCTSLFISNIEDPIAAQLQRFWEIEDVGESSHIENPEDIECETHFKHTHRRDESGRYIVQLPFKRGEIPVLGSNQVFAHQRLKSLSKRLAKNPLQKVLYQENLETYLDAGHMVKASQVSPYLLVHHGVYKESSSTTKLRVVFDPNVKGSNNLSLAESLMVGPKLQTDIGDLIITFRLNAVALISDIQCMYRSIWLADADRQFQHILWYDEKTNQPVEYELTTVTFGLPSSPYQAQRTLKQLVLDEGEKYPLARPVLEYDIYVDDIVTGGGTVTEVINLRDQLISLLGAGGFKLRKWATSHPQVIASLPQEECELSHDFNSDETIKLLGVKWCPATDIFFFTVSPPDPELSTPLTKRKVLSIVASIYDINGYLSPVTVWMKIFLQRLWLEKDLSWDSPLSLELEKSWNSFSSQLPFLRDIKLPRYILTDNVKTIDLVGFADASSAAYGAVMYLRVCDSNNVVTTHLLRSKTKVAPIKVHTINRLELCAALLLVKVLKSLDFLHKRINISNVYLFSDSYTVLSWLKTQPFRLKIYVANRVSQILELTKPNQWRHVSSEKNSADSASRGLMPSQLIDNNLWFKGPSFLRSSPESWPKPIDKVEQCLPELKPNVKTLLVESEEPYLISVIKKYSSLAKLKRVMAYILRFIQNLKNPGQKLLSKHLSLEELNSSLLTCVKITQSYYFSLEIQAVEKEQMCSSNLKFLSPLINSKGILAVGGRLSKAPLPESAKHPVLIPKQSQLATLIVWDYHYHTLHGGPKLVQSLLQQRWWIIGARGLIRQVLFKCVSCCKLKPKFQQPVMADLPTCRFTQGRPFLNVGVDFAGPFSYKTGPRRNSPIDKCYFAVFVCMSTKCIHLELVSSLSTVAFLACLDRFVGRRGLPRCIHSDNGTNFRGASSYLKEVQQFLRDSETAVVHHLHKQEIEWSHIAPHAPNMGGIWEAGVKSVKNHLHHVLQGQNWNFEELSTFLVQVEAILNSRPLCAVSSNPNDGTDYLSPGHFLIGAPMLSRPEYDFVEEPKSHLQRWRLLAHVTQSFWRRWSKDYLNTLIQRSKWIKPCKDIRINDVVIIQGQQLPTQKWPLGIVTKLLPGSDGVTRVVELRTSKGHLLRPVSKVSVLPLDQ